MTIDRIIHLVAGLMVLLGTALAHWVHPNWMLLPALVGLNLAQSSLTRFCPLGFVLKRAGVPE